MRGAESTKLKKFSTQSVIGFFSQITSLAQKKKAKTDHERPQYRNKKKKLERK
jgi:hypothetical protein